MMDAGDVDVVMGGPPCQGVSGNNRHAVKVNILDDSRCAIGSVCCNDRRSALCVAVMHVLNVCRRWLWDYGLMLMLHAAVPLSALTWRKHQSC